MASNNAAPGVALVEKCFKSVQQLVLAAVPWQPLHQPEVTGQRAKGQCALEMCQAGLPQTLPGLQRVVIETWARQLDTQHQVILMAMQAQLVVVFTQSGLRLMAIEAIGYGAQPTVN